MKHGPIALIDDGVPVIVIAPFNSLIEKTFSNMQEVIARGGRASSSARTVRCRSLMGFLETIYVGEFVGF